MQTDNGSTTGGVSRRQFLQGAGGAAAVSAIVTLPKFARGQAAEPAVRSGLKRFAATGGKITLEGTVESRGPVRIGAEAEVKGNVTAPTLGVMAGAVLDGKYEIGTKETGRSTAA